MVSKRDDTFRRVFERINPEALEQCLAKWLQSMLGSIAGEIIPDAMGTQTELVKQIRHKKADYIVSLKANNPTLHSQVKE
jgi:predicted transposase YbfD/YdcC